TGPSTDRHFFTVRQSQPASRAMSAQVAPACLIAFRAPTFIHSPKETNMGWSSSVPARPTPSSTDDDDQRRSVGGPRRRVDPHIRSYASPTHQLVPMKTRVLVREQRR